MNFRTTLLLTALSSVLLATHASCGWLPVSQGHWADYCQPGGTRFNSAVICFITDPTTLKKLSQESFRGFLGPDAVHFALVPKDASLPPTKGGEALTTDKYKVVIEDYNPVEPNCQFVTIYTTSPQKFFSSLKYCPHDRPLTFFEYIFE